MSFILSFHRWAGIFHHFNESSRVCLGFLSISYYPYDVDEALDMFLEGGGNDED